MAALVASRAQHVTIRHAAIPAYIDGLLRQYSLTTKLDDNHLVTLNAEETACYILALDSLNFGSGYFRQARDDGASFGYTLFARSLKSGFAKGRLNEPRKWIACTPSDFHSLFNIPAGSFPSLDALFALFADHLATSGNRILTDYDGRVLNLITSARNSAVSLVETLSAWPAFADRASYHGMAVPLLKRAQIFAADLHLAGIAPFHDMDRLTIFADNRVPHVLRCDGILGYAPELEQKIDAKIPIDSGSAEETELRACAIHAAELMKQAARKTGHNVTSVNIDHILWRRGAEPAISQRPTHRTLTVWY